MFKKLKIKVLSQFADSTLSKEIAQLHRENKTLRRLVKSEYGRVYMRDSLGRFTSGNATLPKEV